MSDLSVPLSSSSFICAAAFSTCTMPYQSQGYSSPPTPAFSRQYAPAQCSTGSRLEYIAYSDSASAPALYAQNISNIPSAILNTSNITPNIYSASAPNLASALNPYLLTAAQAPPFLSSLLYRTGDALPYKSPASDSFAGIFSPQAEYHFQPDIFLKPGKGGKFVGKAEEIQEDIEKAFELLVGEPFPDDIKVSVLPAEEFRKIAPHPSTAGVSFNRRKYGLLSEIFVLNDSLGRVMLTIGHEIGHVLTSPLEKKHDEEAKAYAFSLRWTEIIRKHDIAGLGDAIITEMPAENGLHDVAFRFVSSLLHTGKTAGEIHRELVNEELAVGGHIHL